MTSWISLISGVHLPLDQDVEAAPAGFDILGERNGRTS
jgi:hypothetical protein